MRVVDVVVPEPGGGAHLDPDPAAWHLKTALLTELLALQAVPINRLLKDRYRRFRCVGKFGSYYKVAVERRVSQLQGQFHRGLDELKEILHRRPHPEDGRQ